MAECRSTCLMSASSDEKSSSADGRQSDDGSRAGGNSHWKSEASGRWAALDGTRAWTLLARRPASREILVRAIANELRQLSTDCTRSTQSQMTRRGIGGKQRQERLPTCNI